MPLIHNVHTKTEQRWEVDPAQGMVLRQHQIIGASSIDRIVAPHATFEAEEDGSFDVDDKTAKFFLNQPGWFEGPNPFGTEFPDAPEAEPEPTRVGRARRPVAV